LCRGTPSRLLDAIRSRGAAKLFPSPKSLDELADVLTYLDLLAATLGVDLGRAAAQKFNEVSERVGFPDRIELAL